VIKAAKDSDDPEVLKRALNDLLILIEKALGRKG
jgi:hypothetical protein